MSWRERFPGISEVEWRDWRWQHRHALRTPEEIALCVVSEIVLVRRGGTGLRMRDKLRDEREKPRLKAARV